MMLISVSKKALRSKTATLKQAVTRELCTAYWLTCSVVNKQIRQHLHVLVVMLCTVHVYCNYNLLLLL